MHLIATILEREMENARRLQRKILLGLNELHNDKINQTSLLVVVTHVNSSLFEECK